jgi:hypothetical protein
MKEQRLNFSDYTAEQQEADVQRFIEAGKTVRKPTLYVLKVDGEWAHLDLKLRYKFYGDKNLFQMFNEVKQTHPEYRLKYIINQGLENYLRDMKRRELKNRQLNIWGKNDNRGY